MKRGSFKRLLAAGALLPLCGGVWAQNLSVAILGNQPTAPSALVQNLMGLGVNYFNVSYTGTAWSSGTFTGGNGVIGFNSGIILSNGNAASVVGPSGSGTSNCNNPNPEENQELANLAGVAATDIYDVTILSFDFVPDFNNITFQYVFASSEYNQYVGSEYNDVFAFFLNGNAPADDVAVLPGTSTIIDVNNVNACANSSYYINNNNQPTTLGSCILDFPSANLNTTMTGLTTVLTVNAPVNAGVTNTMELAICDVGDCNLDSNVFIQAGSFSSGPTATPTSSPTPTPTVTATATETPCGYPGNTCTPTSTPTITPTPVYADVFYVSKNAFGPANPVSILVDYTTYPGQYDLWIYNTAGEHIKTLDSRTLSEPVSQWYSWDGKNEYGDPCASGVYIIYLVEPFSQKMRRVVLIR